MSPILQWRLRDPSAGRELTFTLIVRDRTKECILVGSEIWLVERPPN